VAVVVVAVELITQRLLKGLVVVLEAERVARQLLLRK
jgi:hypothetical protein